MGHFRDVARVGISVRKSMGYIATPGVTLVPVTESIAMFTLPIYMFRAAAIFPLVQVFVFALISPLLSDSALAILANGDVFSSHS